MNALSISQTIFYIVSSLTILTIGVMLVIVLYYFIAILRNTRDLSKDIKHSFNRTKKGIMGIINLFSKKGKK